MNRPTYAAIRAHSKGKPVLVFVSSRRQTRLTALELIALAAAEDPQQFVLDEEAVSNQVGSEVLLCFHRASFLSSSLSLLLVVYGGVVILKHVGFVAPVVVVRCTSRRYAHASVCLSVCAFVRVMLSVCVRVVLSLIHI